MVKIIGMDVFDWRFPTSIQSDGSDAVHKDLDVRECFSPDPLSSNASRKMSEARAGTSASGAR